MKLPRTSAQYVWFWLTHQYRIFRAPVGSYAKYTALSEQLRRLGLTEDHGEGAPMCRWRHDDLIIDVMPTDERILVSWIRSS